MNIKEIKDLYIEQANRLGEYQLISKQELGDGYLEAEAKNDKLKMESYVAAIMLRYWYKIYEWKDSCASLHLELDDFVSWLGEVIILCFKYRAWTKEYRETLDENGNQVPNPLYQDPNGFDKAMNNLCYSIRMREYQASNKDKRKANAITYSLDASVDEDGDYALDKAGAFVEEANNCGAKGLVTRYLQRHKFIEALIIDGIAYGDSFEESETSKTIVTKTEVENEDGETVEEEVEDEITSIDRQFKARKLVKHLNSVNEYYMKNHFQPQYGLTDEQAQEILSDLAKKNNTKLYTLIKKTFIEVAQNAELRSFLIA